MSTSEIDREQIVTEIDEANDLVWNQRNSPTHDFDPIKLMNDSLEKSTKINYELGIARCFLNSGMARRMSLLICTRSIVRMEKCYSFIAMVMPISLADQKERNSSRKLLMTCYAKTLWNRWINKSICWKEVLMPGEVISSKWKMYVWWVYGSSQIQPC